MATLPPFDPRLALVFLFALCATPLLARLALRRRWADDPGTVTAKERARKLQRRAVPTVGGPILLVCGIGFLLARHWGQEWGGMATSETAWVRACTPSPVTLAIVLALAFAVGWWDDRRGLSPARKLLWQGVALSPFVLAAAFSGKGMGPACALFSLGLVSLNALNTFDNADGALATLGIAGFSLSLPPVAMAFSGFVPWNLDARRRGDGGPTAYLGDAGAFTAGALVLATPHAWALLWIPLLDLGRLSWVRTRAGSRPWIGDRRHLAHRLSGAGLSALAVAGLQVACAVPALWGWIAALNGERAGPALVGCVASLVLFLALLSRTSPPGACPQVKRAE
ncbi:MAG: hypothetical protein CMJ89_06305 [Planctomycetes bacterium]|jgi:UDP-N-acetylmuramyl pentapeptide phosphotransferase/UDP-N-acetylglucosamine-1-phosphate transferase|nr:hypothetical protein [Planctomycetota bacterium]